MMKVDRYGITAYKIEVTGLDLITAYVEDFNRGEGKLTIECYGRAWSAYWGSMGDQDLIKFVSECDVDYVADRMIVPNSPSNIERYFRRIVTAVQGAFEKIALERPDAIMNISDCSACGSDHPDMEFAMVDSPSGDGTTLMAICPTNHTEIYAYDDKDPRVKDKVTGPGVSAAKGLRVQ